MRIVQWWLHQLVYKERMNVTDKSNAQIHEKDKSYSEESFGW